MGSHCVECVRAAAPGVQTRVRNWQASRPLLVTTALIAINLAVFVYQVIRDTAALGGGRVTDAEFDLGLNPFLIKFDDSWYRLVTSGFIHFGFFHLLMNMVLLYQLGLLLERAVGRPRFAALYFAALLAGSAGQLIVDPNSCSIAGGASGAVFGLLGAAAVGLWRRGVNVFSTGIGTVLLLNLVLTFTIPGISIGGHLGGVVGGAIIGFVMLSPHHRPMPVWAGYATAAAVAGAAVLISVLLINNLTPLVVTR